MTLEPPAAGQEPDAGLAGGRLFAELTGLLREVTGEDAGWAAAITPQSRLEADLRLESIEFAALAGKVTGRYGREADLLGYVAGLDIDEIIALTVADLVSYLAAHRGAGE
jgi:acyl carrier protein